MRKLRHPRILKILEVLEHKPDLAFVAEPVASSIASKIGQLHPMDASYISFQVAEALAFLTQEASLVHLGLTPNAVILDDELAVKLFSFQWAATLTNTNQAVVPAKLLHSKVLADLQFQAPEVLSAQNATALTDVFIFGLFMYTAFTGQNLSTADTLSEILNALPVRIGSVYNVPADFRSLIQSCLSMVPSGRPAFSEVLQSTAFQSMQMKSLRYIDLLMTKDPADKLKFYKGLALKIETFSPTLLRIKILPALLAEIGRDVRFAPVLLSSILFIGVPLSTEEFMSVIWIKLAPLTNLTTPPEISIALLKDIQKIIAKIDRSLHKDYVYPIVTSALQSSDPKIHREVLAQIPYIVSQMTNVSVRSLLLPRILDLAGSSADPANISSSIRCISECLQKADHDSFAADVLPKLMDIWHKTRSTSVGSAIVSVIEKLNAGSDLMMTKAVPLAAEIAGAHSLELDDRNRLCDWIVTTVQNFKANKTTAFKPGSKIVSDSDNPFGEGAAQPPPAATPKPAPVPKPAPAITLTSDDIFGPPSNPAASAPVAAPKQAPQIDFMALQPMKTQPAASHGSNPGFAPQPAAKPAQASSGVNLLGGMDVFGPPNPAPARAPLNPPPQPARHSQGLGLGPQIGFGGPPQQQMGFGGQQQQQMGFGGPPQQQMGFGGPPQQQMGFGGPPQQQMGFGGPPQQQMRGPPQNRGPQQGQGRVDDLLQMF
jgi:serine/threonine protein kinase